MITQHVKEAIAQIEVHRQAMEKEGSLTTACNEALRKLHELLDHERDAVQPHGPAGEHPANVEAVTAEIERVKSLVSAAGKGGMLKQGRPHTQKHVGPSQPHNPPRNKGRRTMGRTGGR